MIVCFALYAAIVVNYINCFSNVDSFLCSLKKLLHLLYVCVYTSQVYICVCMCIHAPMCPCVYVCMHVRVCASVCVHNHSTFGIQKTIFGSWFSPSSIWVLGIELRLGDSVFTLSHLASPSLAFWNKSAVDMLYNMFLMIKFNLFINDGRPHRGHKHTTFSSYNVASAFDAEVMVGL